MRNALAVVTACILSIILLLYSCSKNDTPPPQLTGNNNNGGGTDSLPFPGTTNVVYGTAVDWKGNTTALTMDVYLPANMNAGTKYPLVVFAHGGGFVTGDKSFSAAKCKILADSGFVAATINYRVGWSDGGAVPCSGDTVELHFALYRAMQDMNAAIRFLVAHARDYHIDSNWIFAAGSSAGAVLANMSTYVSDSYASWRYPQEATELGSLTTADNSFKNKYFIRGICSISGCTEDSMLVNATQAVPSIFFHGEDDNVVPLDHGTYLYCPNYPKLYGTLCLYRRLRANNAPAVAHLLPNAGHGNNGDGGFSDAFMMGNASCFFHSLMRKDGLSQTGVYVGPDNNSCK